jgi:ubiquinone biosynthesis protein
MNWELPIAENIFDYILPEVYAHYSKPLFDAVKIFLQGLSSERRENLAMEQAALPPEATSLERLILLARNCPVLHKLGQTLARDRNLPAPLRWMLQRLESLFPTIPIETVESLLTRELGPLHLLGVNLLPPALAEGSVAVVVPFDFSGNNAPRRGVFKVLKPGIETRLEEDLDTLDRVGSFLDDRCNDLRIPHLEYRESFEHVREKLQYEVRLDEEQRNISLARDFHRADSSVLVPVLYDFCTPRITAMEQVIGQKVTECCQDLNEKHRMARVVIGALIARPIFSVAVRPLFHGDPHAGNLLATNDGRLAIVDWSLTGSLKERERISIMQILLGAVTFSVEKVVTVLAGLSERQSIDLPSLRSVVFKWIERVKKGRMPGLAWMTGLLDEAVVKAGLGFGADLMLFRKSLLMIEGVVADLGGGSELIDQVLMNEFAIHFFFEWPWRFASSPGSRSFATGISNADLLKLTLSFPWRFMASLK